MAKVKALHKSLEQILGNRKRRKSRLPQKREIPEVLLTAITRWEKGYIQLKRNTIREVLNLRGYWGYFVMLCILADYKTSTLETNVLTLCRMFGLTRKYVYKVLKILDQLKYIVYTPAKGRYQTEINIAIPKYKTYVGIKKDKENDSTRVKMTPVKNRTRVKMTPVQGKNEKIMRSGENGKNAQKSRGNEDTGDKMSLVENSTRVKMTPVQEISSQTNNLLKNYNKDQLSSINSSSRVKMTLLEKGSTRVKMTPVQPKITKKSTPLKTLKTLKTTTGENSVVVNFFNQKFKNQQNTLSSQTIDSLLQNHILEKILLYLNRIPSDNSIRNPAGLLYKALTNNWELTPTREEAKKRQKAIKDKEYKEQEEQDRKERLKLKEAQAEEERLNRIFAGLPKEQQDKLKVKAMETLKAEHKGTSPQILNIILNSETMLMAKVWDLLGNNPGQNLIKDKQGFKEPRGYKNPKSKKFKIQATLISGDP